MSRQAADRFRSALAATAVLVLVALPGSRLAAQQPAPPPVPVEMLPAEAPETPGLLSDVDYAMVRLPLACVLGAVLALRPKRRGTPTRTPAVVQTQIILAVVGALIMLVVGSSLARAFGIVGAANLIRYRAKIEDPKDAGVMLCTLAVGLAAGVGLYALSIFATLFIMVVLSVIESFEPKRRKQLELTVKHGEHAAELRGRLEGVLDRYKFEYELRTAADEELVYLVTMPFDVETDVATNAILRLDPENPPAVVWEEKKPTRK